MSGWYAGSTGALAQPLSTHRGDPLKL